MKIRDFVPFAQKLVPPDRPSRAEPRGFAERHRRPGHPVTGVAQEIAADAAPRQRQIVAVRRDLRQPRDHQRRLKMDLLGFHALAAVRIRAVEPAGGIPPMVEDMEDGRSLMVCFAPGIEEGGVALEEGAGIGANPCPERGTREIFTVWASASSLSAVLIVGEAEGAAEGVSLIVWAAEGAAGDVSLIV